MVSAVTLAVKVLALVTFSKVSLSCFPSNNFRLEGNSCKALWTVSFCIAAYLLKLCIVLHPNTQAVAGRVPIVFIPSPSWCLPELGSPLPVTGREAMLLNCLPFAYVLVTTMDICKFSQVKKGWSPVFLDFIFSLVLGLNVPRRDF